MRVCSNPQRRRLAFGWSALVLLLAACSGEVNKTPSVESAFSPLAPATTLTGSIAPSPTVQGTESARFGQTLRDYLLLDDGQGRVLHDAYEKLLVRCMEKLGFEYRPAIYVSPAAPTSGYPSDQLLAQFGYEWRLHSVQSQVVGSLEPTMSEDSPEAQALNEPCGPEASAGLDPSEWEAANGVFRIAESEMVDAAGLDLRYTSAVAEWSACMAATGYSFARLNDAVAAAYELPGGALSVDGLRQAAVDYRCQRDAGVAETMRTIGVELTSVWIEQHPEALADLKKQQDALVARATAVLGE